MTRRSLAILGGAAGLAALVCGSALAEDYGTFIDVETEEDLLDLLRTDEIDDDAYQTLKELLTDGVDLNEADREELYALPNLSYADVDAIIEYRQMAGRMDSPAALVVAGVLPANVVVAMAPFLIDTGPSTFGIPVSGQLDYRTTYGFGESGLPEMWLRGRVKTFGRLKLSVAGRVIRNEVDDVVWDPNRDALSAKLPDNRLELPKFYLEWKDKRLHAIAGTYRIGFGQGLVFDDSGRERPNDIYSDDAIDVDDDRSRLCREIAGELTESPCAGSAAGQKAYAPGYKTTKRLRGAAIGLKKLEIGDHWLQTYGFFSYATRDIYQYELFDSGRCDDPNNDDDDACKSPKVYLRRDDILAPTPGIAYSTLPRMYDELLGGGNVSYFLSRRTHFGVTGYGASIDWLPDGAQLDFQEWSTRPWGGPFGAVGLDAAVGINRFDLFFEAARSFDSQPDGGGGGFGAVAGTIVTFDKHELDASLRYYDQAFANPYGSPPSAPDEYEGLRARDEMGLRIKHNGKIKDLQLRSALDYSMAPSSLDDEPRSRLDLRARGDYELTTWFKPGLWVGYTDKNVEDTSRSNCYETSDEETPQGEPVPCAGERILAGLQLRFDPTRKLWFTALYKHAWVDDGKADFADKFRQDAAIWLEATYKPLDDLRLKARFRYLYEDIEHPDYLERSYGFYVEGQYWIDRLLRIKLRYAMEERTDERASTQLLDPNPAHWARLDLEYRF